MSLEQYWLGDPLGFIALVTSTLTKSRLKPLRLGSRLFLGKQRKILSWMTFLHWRTLAQSLFQSKFVLGRLASFLSKWVPVNDATSPNFSIWIWPLILILDWLKGNVVVVLGDGTTSLTVAGDNHYRFYLAIANNAEVMSPETTMVLCHNVVIA